MAWLPFQVVSIILFSVKNDRISVVEFVSNNNTFYFLRHSCSEKVMCKKRRHNVLETKTKVSARKNIFSLLFQSNSDSQSPL